MLSQDERRKMYDAAVARAAKQFSAEYDYRPDFSTASHFFAAGVEFGAEMVKADFDAILAAKIAESKQ